MMPTDREPRRPSRLHWLAALLLCALLPVGVLWSPLFGDTSTLSFDEGHPRYPAPWYTPQPGPWPLINPITSDGDFMVLPGMMRLAQYDSAGAPFGWDSGQLLGHALVANQVYPVFLPWARALLHADPLSAMDWLLAFHMALAAFLSYRAVRLLGGSAVAGAFAAVGMSLSTWMITRWHLPAIHYTTACFPGLVAAVEWLRRGRMAAAVAEGALWIGVALLAGFPQVGLLLMLGYFGMVLLERRLWGWRPLAAATLAAALGLGLGWPLLNTLPTVYPASARASETSRLAMGGAGLRPAALLGALVPEFFGRPSDFSTEEPPAPSMQAWLPRRLLLSDDVQDNPVEDALYPGMAVLLLLPLLLRRAAGAPARQLGLLAALAVGGALLAAWAIATLPVLAALGGASTKRLIVLAAASLPLAAGLLLDGIRKRTLAVPGLFAALLLAALGTLSLVFANLDQPDAAAFSAALRPQLVRQAALLLAALLLLVGHARGSRLAGPLLVGVLLIDLVTLGWAFNPFPHQPEQPFGPRASLEWLAQRSGRVAVLGERRILPPCGATLHGIRCLHGSVPMMDRRTAELLATLEPDLVNWRDPRSVEPLRQLETLEHNLLDLLEVSTVVHADPGLAARRGQPNAYENVADGLAAFERPGAGPRAFVCGGAEVVPDARARLAWLGDPQAPVHASVLLESEDALLPLEGRTLPARGPMLPAEVRAESPGHFELLCDAPFDGVLVLVEGWHSGWRARLDGQPVEMECVDHALLGIVVPAGAHVLELDFEIPGERASRWLQGVAALVVLGCACRAIARPHAG